MTSVDVKLTSASQLVVVHKLIEMQSDIIVSKDLLARQMAHDNVYSIMLGNEVVGVIRGRLLQGEAELDQIVVHPDYQNQGVGFRSLSSWINQLKNNNAVSKIFLEVRENNIHAVRLYCKLGFIKIAQRKNYYRIGAESFNADVMELSI
jgi:ribosomal-protein-alanine acetyltransferase